MSRTSTSTAIVMLASTYTGIQTESQEQRCPLLCLSSFLVSSVTLEDARKVRHFVQRMHKGEPAALEWD